MRLIVLTSVNAMIATSLSFAQTGGDLLPKGPELVDVQTAANNVVILLIRDN